MIHSCFADDIVDEARVMWRANSFYSTLKGVPVADHKLAHRDLSIERFVECQNIIRYVEMLKSEIDLFKRRRLIELLTEEKAKHASPLKGIELNPDQE